MSRGGGWGRERKTHLCARAQTPAQNEEERIVRIQECHKKNTF